LPVHRGSEKYSHTTIGVSLLSRDFRIEDDVKEKEKEALSTSPLIITLFSIRISRFIWTGGESKRKRSV